MGKVTPGLEPVWVPDQNALCGVIDFGDKLIGWAQRQNCKLAVWNSTHHSSFESGRRKRNKIRIKRDPGLPFKYFCPRYKSLERRCENGINLGVDRVIQRYLPVLPSVLGLFFFFYLFLLVEKVKLEELI